MSRSPDINVVDLMLTLRAENLLASLSLRTVRDVRRYLKSEKPTGNAGTWEQIRKHTSVEYLQKLRLEEAEERQRPHRVVLCLWQVGSSLFLSEAKAARRQAWWQERLGYVPISKKRAQERRITLIRSDWKTCRRVLRLLEIAGASVFMRSEYGTETDDEYA